MPSVESVEARRALHKERVDPAVTLAEERAAWDAYGATLPLAPDVSCRVDEIAGVVCATLRPAAGPADRPVVLYAHGGGLVTGSILTHRAFASDLAAALGSTVILPDYRLMPDHPLTAPSDDLLSVYGALRAMNVEVILGGDSSGAGLVLTTMVRLRAQGADLPAWWFSLSGAFDATLSGASIQDKDADDPILSEAVLRHWQGQLGSAVALENPLISPLFADLSGLPRSLLLVGADEVWLDDSRRLQDALAERRVPADLHVFDGMWHVWPMTRGLPESAAAFRLIRAFGETPHRD